MSTRAAQEAGEAQASEVAQRFAIDGRPTGVQRLGRGHIHDTFELRIAAADGARRFVLQRINDRVFRSPDDVVDNVARVTEHLRRQLAGEPDHERRCLRLVPARDGGNRVVDADGSTWRAYPFIEHSVALERVQDETQAFVAARAFGDFVARLADLPPERLAETVPNFHDLDGRCAALERAAARNAAGRDLGDLEPELAHARRAHATLAEALDGLGALPRRVVHNDCKLDNVLLDADSGAALCVIDLDTVMEGTLLADFGDLVRTAANPAAEDERDLSRVDFDLACFGALARGYVTGLGEALTEAECAALPLAGPVLALENGVRFLTDHLDGDVYFAAHRPGHNLDRARCQLRLLERMLERADEARALVDAAASGARASSTAG